MLVKIHEDLAVPAERISYLDYISDEGKLPVKTRDGKEWAITGVSKRRFNIVLGQVNEAIADHLLLGAVGGNR